MNWLVRDRGIRQDLWRPHPAHSSAQASTTPHRYSFPELLKRVFRIDKSSRDKRMTPRTARSTGIILKDNGGTGDVTRLWLGARLIDLTRHEA